VKINMPKTNKQIKPKKQRGKKSNPVKAAVKTASSVASLVEELGPLLAMLPFPTSGASAMASPQLALGGYNNSMALSAPAANGTYVKHTKARMRSNKSGMSIRHREYIQDIAFGEAGMFNLAVQQPINPGNRNLFPWLSGISGRFETYRFNSLRFIYEPQCGTENEGTIMVAVDFDAVDPPPVDKLQFMTYDGAVRSPPWFASVYDCAQYNIHKYKEYYITRDQITPPTTDEKTYFVGNIFVATQSQSDPFTAGEFYVEYDVVLSTPQLDSISGDQSKFFHVQANNNVDPAIIAEDFGSLDVISEPALLLWNGDPVEVIISTPGAYHVTITAAGNAQNPIVDISVTGPPAGFAQTAIYPLGAAGNVNFGTNTALLLGLTGPLWFTYDVSFEGSDRLDVFIVISPLDAETYLGLGPQFTPPLVPLLTRREKLLNQMKFLHSAKNRGHGKKDQPLLLEEKKKPSEPVVPKARTPKKC
jgi:hypothetical protein